MNSETEQQSAMRIIVTCAVILLGCFTVSGQSVAQKKEQAKSLFYNNKYAETLNVLTETRSLLRDDRECRFWAAVCNFQLNQLDPALRQLTELTQERTPYPECWLYLGKIFHARHEFEEASRNYKLYLRAIGLNHPNRAMVIDAIRRASNGQESQFRQPLAAVENLGPGVNTAADEFAPIISPNHPDRLYFSSVRPGNTGGARSPDGRLDPVQGQFFSDMFTCHNEKGVWGETAAMHYLLNSPRHEVLLDFNQGGDVLYYFKGWSLDQGEIVVDTFREANERGFSSIPFNSPMDPAAGDGMPYIFQDTLLIFASRRPGGMGGWDLYQSKWKYGVWSKPVNMGPPVNTPYDEVTPFLARDGKTLFFSSNDSRKSIGGLDIFKTVRNEDGQWVQPYNLGIPINSAGDDAYFRLSKDGFTAYLASSRKDGLGQRDIYAAYFMEYQEEMEPPQAYVPPVVHTVTTNTFPDPAYTAPAPVSVQPPAPVEQPAEPPAQPAGEPSGDYSIRLVPGSRPLSEQDRARLDQVAGIMRQYAGLTLVITAYAPEGQAVNKSLFSAIQGAEAVSKYLMDQGIAPGKLFTRSVGISGVKGPGTMVDLGFCSAVDAPAQDQVPVVGQNFKAGIPGLTVNKALHYKIQVASSKGEIGSGFLAGQPEPMVEKTPDFAYYRYTVGAFDSYQAAAAFLKSVRGQGFNDAYIVPYIYGARADKVQVRQFVNTFPDLKNYLK